MEKEYKVRFQKISNNHNRLRSDDIEGVTNELPTEGKSFVFFGKGLEFGTRVVNTSPVKIVLQKDDEYILHTESGSIYQVNLI